MAARKRPDLPPEAEQDLRSIFGYVWRHASGAIAERIVHDIYEICIRLGEFPELGNRPSATKPCQPAPLKLECLPNRNSKSAFIVSSSDSAELMSAIRRPRDARTR